MSATKQSEHVLDCANCPAKLEGFLEHVQAGEGEGDDDGLVQHGRRWHGAGDVAEGTRRCDLGACERAKDE